MTPQDILEKIHSRFPDIAFDLQQGQVGGTWLAAPAESIVPTMRFLKEELGLNYLACLSGIDYSTSLAVVYYVRSLEKKNRACRQGRAAAGQCAGGIGQQSLRQCGLV